MTKKQINRDVLLLIGAIFGLMMIGTVIFSLLENWSFLDAFYFVTITSTSIGYGDLVPTTAASKIFTIIYTISIVPFILYAFSVIANAQMEKVYSKIHHLEKKQEEQKKELDDTARKLRRQKTLILQQEEQLNKQERNLKYQKKVMLTKEHELQSQQDKELALVENLMEEALVR